MMKHILLFAALMAALAFHPLAVHAQVEVKRSEKIELVKGEKFYMHTVEAGQTIYSIGRAYGVEVHEIYTYNPGSKELLSLGQELLIPFKEEKEETESPGRIPVAKDGFVYHEVQAGETLYRIMLKYGLKEEILKEYNPGLTTDIYPGQLIRVPEPEKVVSDKSQELYDSVFVYTVQEKETYYQLQKKFNVMQGQLEQLNPELKQLGLQKGMQIKVPHLDRVMNEVPKVVFVPEVLDYSLPFDTAAIVPVSCDSFGYIKPSYKVAFMMPFFSDQEANINISSPYKMKTESAYPSFRFIHFYEGFLMAADSMAKLGMNIELFVYDTKNDTNTVKQIVQQEGFREMDIVFGPLFTHNLRIVANALKGTEARVINPLSVNTSLLKGNEKMFYLQPFLHAKTRQMISFVNDSLPHAQVSILHNNSKEELYIANLLKKQYRAAGLDSTRIHVFNYQEKGYNNMVKALDKKNPNVLINLVSNEAYISNFVRNLYKKSEDYNIILLGDEKHWKQFKTLEYKYLFALNLTLTSSTFVDYRQAPVARFVLDFRETYKTEPNQMAFQGYDAGWFFLNALYRYGTHFEPCMQHMDIHLLQSDFDFVSNGVDAWSNRSASVYQYKDFQLINKRRTVIPIPEEWLKAEEPQEVEEGQELQPEAEDQNDGSE